MEAAKAAGRTQTYLGAQYRRLARRIGANRAALAVAHSIAVISHRIIDRGEDYVDLGYHYFEQPGRAPLPAARCANWNAWGTT